MNDTLARSLLLATLGLLAACGNETAVGSQAPAKEAPSSMSGATCAVLPNETQLGSWKHRSEIVTCMRDLAATDWAQARAEAEHIDGWDMGASDLDEINAVLSRFESAEEVRETLEAGGLLKGEGQAWMLEYYGENWKPLTGTDWLNKAGNMYSFDAETGMHPNEHHVLLSELAKLFGDALEGAKFTENAPHWDSDEPYQLSASLGERTWERQAQNYGDWYDVSTVLDLLNEMAAAADTADRIMPLETGDQTVQVVVGPGQSLVDLAADGIISPAGADSSRQRGKAAEEEFFRQYRIKSE